MEDITKTLEIPVIFYDGEKEIDLGKVQIISLMTFKILQSTLSNKIGISPNHITIYLDRNANNNNNLHHHHHHRRRHPVTSKFDFAALREGGCIFWVVLKRGRRNRRRHNGKNDVVNNGPVLILPRGVGVSEFENWEYLEYVNRLRMIDQIEREKERYLMSLNLNSNVYNELSGYNHLQQQQQQQHYPNYDYNHPNNYDNYNNKSSSSNYSDDYRNYEGVDVDMASCSSSTGGASSSETATTRVYCDVCYNSSSTAAGDDTVPFHWCKNDVVVTTRTRSRVGPIAPPLKNSLCA